VRTVIDLRIDIYTFVLSLFLIKVELIRRRENPECRLSWWRLGLVLHR